MTSPSAFKNPLRHAVLQSYKNLLYLGREYPHPGGYRWFREKLHRAYSRNVGERDEDAIREGIRRAEYVAKEIEALYYLKKYRAVKRMYAEEVPASAAGAVGQAVVEPSPVLKKLENE